MSSCGIFLAVAGIFATLGLDAAVVCFGAGGGLRSPGTKSKIGLNLSRMLFRSASRRPSSSGIQVPKRAFSHRNPCQAVKLRYTLVLAISTLHLFMDALLNLALQNARSRGFIKPSHFEDVRSIDPIVGPSSHNMVAIDLEFIHRYLDDEERESDQERMIEAQRDQDKTLTLLYVAEYILGSFVPAMLCASAQAALFQVGSRTGDAGAASKRGRAVVWLLVQRCNMSRSSWNQRHLMRTELGVEQNRQPRWLIMRSLAA